MLIYFQNKTLSNPTAKPDSSGLGVAAATSGAYAASQSAPLSPAADQSLTAPTAANQSLMSPAADQAMSPAVDQSQPFVITPTAEGQAGTFIGGIPPGTIGPDGQYIPDEPTEVPEGYVQLADGSIVPIENVQAATGGQYGQPQ